MFARSLASFTVIFMVVFLLVRSAALGDGKPQIFHVAGREVGIVVNDTIIPVHVLLRCEISPKGGDLATIIAEECELTLDRAGNRRRLLGGQNSANNDVTSALERNGDLAGDVLLRLDWDSHGKLC